METDTTEKQSAPIVLSSPDEGEEVQNTTKNGSTDMDTQEETSRAKRKAQADDNPGGD